MAAMESHTASLELRDTIRAAVAVAPAMLHTRLELVVRAVVAGMKPQVRQTRAAAAAWAVGVAAVTADPASLSFTTLLVLAEQVEPLSQVAVSALTRSLQAVPLLLQAA